MSSKIAYQERLGARNTRKSPRQGGKKKGNWRGAGASVLKTQKESKNTPRGTSGEKRSPSGGKKPAKERQKLRIDLAAI